MKNIVVLSTGGTIASVKNESTGLLSAGVLTGEELIALCNINFDINIEVHSILQIPSNQMSFEKIILLKECVEEVLRREDVDGIVITHGTDTLEETSYFLDLTIPDTRPIVLTGAQLGPSELGTDALINIRQAILVAASSESRDIGTLVVFNGKIFTARHVTKFHTSSVNGFTSYGFGYIGIIDLNNVYYYQKPYRSKTYRIKSSLPKVEIVKFSLGSDASYIKYLIEKGYRGLILEGYGRGHIYSGAVEHVSDAIAKGLKVIITSTCKEGEVAKIYDYVGGVWDLVNMGVVNGKDYDSKKARIKLAVLLAAEIGDIQEEFNF